MLNEEKHHNYKVDFLIARENKICPLEIKVSGYKRHASLDAFCAKFAGRYVRLFKGCGRDLSVGLYDAVCVKQENAEVRR